MAADVQHECTALGLNTAMFSADYTRPCIALSEVLPVELAGDVPCSAEQANPPAEIKMASVSASVAEILYTLDPTDERIPLEDVEEIYETAHGVLDDHDQDLEDSEFKKEKLRLYLKTVCLCLDNETECQPEQQLHTYAELISKAESILHEEHKWSSDEVTVSPIMNEICAAFDDCTAKNSSLKRKRDELESIDKIRLEQNCTDLVFPKNNFKLLVCEIGQYVKHDLHWEGSALEALQIAGEDYLVQMFQLANKAAIHAGRDCLLVADIQLVQFVREQLESRGMFKGTPYPRD